MKNRPGVSVHHPPPHESNRPAAATCYLFDPEPCVLLCCVTSDRSRLTEFPNLSVHHRHFPYVVGNLGLLLEEQTGLYTCRVPTRAALQLVNQQGSKLSVRRTSVDSGRRLVGLHMVHCGFIVAHARRPRSQHSRIDTCLYLSLDCRVLPGVLNE